MTWTHCRNCEQAVEPESEHWPVDKLNGICDVATDLEKKRGRVYGTVIYQSRRRTTI